MQGKAVAEVLEMIATRNVCAAAIAILLSGCGEEPPLDNTGADYRVLDTTEAKASCDQGELLLSAYCFSNVGRSVSASGPALQQDSEGRLVVSCLTGGPNLRLICAKLP